jgi:hypothetical protein
MAKMTLIGDDNLKGAPTPNSPEAAAREAFYSRISGPYAGTFPIHKWREDQRERFLAELRRLQTEHERQRVLAVEQAGQRSDEQFRSRA